MATFDDFNMISSTADKNNHRLNHRGISRFRHFITDMELHDIYLHGRRYTWSNEQDNPTLVRIDKALCTLDWETAHPNCLLRCHASAISDHCPLVLDSAPCPGGSRRFHFECFWPKLAEIDQVIVDAWLSVDHEPDPFRRIFLRLKATAHHLQSWSSRTIGDISL